MGRQGYSTTQQLPKENKHPRKQTWTSSTGGVTLLPQRCATYIIITPRSPSYTWGSTEHHFPGVFQDETQNTFLELLKDKVYEMYLVTTTDHEHIQ